MFLATAEIYFTVLYTVMVIVEVDMLCEQNVMTFDKCTINGHVYGDLFDEEGNSIDITEVSIMHQLTTMFMLFSRIFLFSDCSAYN